MFYEILLGGGRPAGRFGGEFMIQDDLEQIRQDVRKRLSEAFTPEEINQIRVEYLGKKGRLTGILKGMKNVAAEDRPRVGQMVNVTRTDIESIIDLQQNQLLERLMEERLKAEAIDVTLPPKEERRGHLHPNTDALKEIEDIFISMGYEVVDGPEIEKDYYNFEALNIPPDHPAKDEQDTFYINGDMLLRTQTSGNQIHEMEKGRIPIRMIAPGRVYRADEVDATHSPVFHQVEGLVIDRGITFADLKGTLEESMKAIFGEDTQVRFRPHHFPFTEPSAECDISCYKCGGKGCSFCKNEGWIEILGCGMVHPHVLEMSGIDPEEYSGFAFGIGLERIALLKYEIDDMRLLYENDRRFIDQF